MVLNNGRWHKATVTKNARKNMYSVKSEAGTTWDASKDNVRDMPLNIHDIHMLSTANNDVVLHAVKEKAKRYEIKREQAATKQLESLLSCLTPTPYKYSQHYQSRQHDGGYEAYTKQRSDDKLPEIMGKLVYVGEQDFFGTNMLGAFSTTNWGMPTEGMLSKPEREALNEMCKKKFSFGPSCFIVDIEKMVKKVYTLTTHLICSFNDKMTLTICFTYRKDLNGK